MHHLWLGGARFSTWPWYKVGILRSTLWYTPTEEGVVADFWLVSIAPANQMWACSGCRAWQCWVGVSRPGKWTVGVQNTSLWIVSCCQNSLEQIELSPLPYTHTDIVKEMYISLQAIKNTCIVGQCFSLVEHKALQLDSALELEVSVVCLKVDMTVVW